MFTIHARPISTPRIATGIGRDFHFALSRMANNIGNPRAAARPMPVEILVLTANPAAAAIADSMPAVNVLLSTPRRAT